MSEAKQNKQLLSVGETADALSLRPGTIRAWIASRRIGHVKLGRSVRVHQAEINRLLERGTIPAREERR